MGSGYAFRLQHGHSCEPVAASGMGRCKEDGPPVPGVSMLLRAYYTADAEVPEAETAASRPFEEEDAMLRERPWQLGTAPGARPRPAAAAAAASSSGPPALCRCSFTCGTRCRGSGPRSGERRAGHARER